MFETHARRLERRGVGRVETATYKREPGRELRDALRDVSGERVYGVPMVAAHGYETREDVPAALATAAGTARYCEPVGRSPAVTVALAERAEGQVAEPGEASLVVVSLGGGTGDSRRVTERHVERLRRRTAYDEVIGSYLLENPAVECARYTATNDTVVAVPLFVGRCGATDDRIPAQLEADQSGVVYTDPLGEERLLTDAVQSEVARRRALADGSDTLETGAAEPPHPMVADGEGERDGHDGE